MNDKSETSSYFPIPMKVFIAALLCVVATSLGCRDDSGLSIVVAASDSEASVPENSKFFANFVIANRSSQEQGIASAFPSCGCTRVVDRLHEPISWPVFIAPNTTLELSAEISGTPPFGIRETSILFKGFSQYDRWFLKIPYEVLPGPSIEPRHATIDVKSVRDRPLLFVVGGMATDHFSISKIELSNDSFKSRVFRFDPSHVKDFSNPVDNWVPKWIVEVRLNSVISRLYSPLFVKVHFCGEFPPKVAEIDFKDNVRLTCVPSEVRFSQTDGFSGIVKVTGISEDGYVAFDENSLASVSAVRKISGASYFRLKVVDHDKHKHASKHELKLQEFVGGKPSGKTGLVHLVIE